MMADKTGNGYQFGTFKGVFTPSILTILGVIMYLRFGWVLGNVGLFKTLLIVTISTSITFLTGLSISALATNMKVGGGGTYFIISRSLGLETGAAVSLPLYFAQALGISFYIAGFAESVSAMFPFLSMKLTGLATLLALGVLSYISANIALKAQFLILLLVVSSLVSFFMGHPVEASNVPAIQEYQPFWKVFAVFFPAVTGIEAGIAMSGDLKNPERSLPLGTLGAIVTSYFVYLVIPIYLSFMVKDRNLLISNPFIMKDVARWGILIVLGVWGATLSSALGAMLGAPRTLQALAKDKVLPQIIGRGFGNGNDPRIAVVISFMVALIGILAGDLNAIAPILSMFFLTAYGILNLSAAFEGLIASPSWRPKFNVPWPVSLAGAAICFAAMFMINAGATFIALVVSSLVYFIMKKRRINASWSDMRYGILMLVLYFVIYRLEDRKPDERTWRPNLLVLSGSPQARWHLISIADAITCNRGLLTVSTIIPDDDNSSERAVNLKSVLRSYLMDNRVRALIKVHPANDMLTGAREMVKAYGFGSVSPNTILLGETEKEENFIEYARLIKLVHTQRKNMIIMRNGEIQVSPNEPLKMDILWRGQQNNAGLMLAIAYLIQASGRWPVCTLRLKTIITDRNGEDDVERNLRNFIEKRRIKAKAEVVVGSPDKSVFKTIRENIGDSNLVFIGMRPPLDGETLEEYSEYYKFLLKNTENFPTTIMVLASENIEFNRIFSEV